MFFLKRVPILYTSFLLSLVHLLFNQDKTHAYWRTTLIVRVLNVSSYGKCQKFWLAKMFFKNGFKKKPTTLALAVILAASTAQNTGLGWTKRRLMLVFTSRRAQICSSVPTSERSCPLNCVNGKNNVVASNLNSSD